MSATSKLPAGLPPLPEGCTVPTSAELRLWNQKWVDLPESSAHAGEKRVALVRAIRKGTYSALLPSGVPGSDAWPDDVKERVKLYNAWMEAQPAEIRTARNRQLDDVVTQVVVLGLVYPKWTADEVLDMGSDADVLHDEILLLSGITKPKKKPEEAKAEDKAEAAAIETPGPKLTVPTPVVTAPGL